jgi:hypothetical protein
MQCNCLKYNYLIFRTPLYRKGSQRSFCLKEFYIKVKLADLKYSVQYCFLGPLARRVHSATVGRTKELLAGEYTSLKEKPEPSFFTSLSCDCNAFEIVEI